MKYANVALALGFLVATACDGWVDVPSQFSDLPPQVESGAGPGSGYCFNVAANAVPQPLQIHVSGKTVADKAVITVDVHGLPFAHPIDVYGLLHYTGPDDGAPWYVDPPAVTDPAVFQTDQDYGWHSLSYPLRLDSTARHECPQNTGDFEVFDTRKFRIRRFFDGPLANSPVQVSLHAEAHALGKATPLATLDRKMTVNFTDIPSTAQYWPKGPLVLVRRAGNSCGDAFVHAINLGDGHAPVGGLQIHNGSANLNVRTLLQWLPDQDSKPEWKAIEAHDGVVALPSGWQIDARADQIWHVQYCPASDDPPLDASLSLLQDPATTWTIDASSAVVRSGCLRVAQGDPLDLTAAPWVDLKDGHGLKVDLFNVCDHSELVGAFQGFGSPHIHFSAAPFGPFLEAKNFGESVLVDAHKSVPLYVAYEFDEAGLPDEISATLLASNGAQFHFAAHKLK